MYGLKSAALQIARAGAVPTVQQASDAYAVAFVGIRGFNAGVVLCNIAGHEPLSKHSLEARSGIRRFLSMQKALRDRFPIAAQGFTVLQKLT